MKINYKMISKQIKMACAVSLLLLAGKTFSQNQNALNFDGVDDNVTAPNASGLIANSMQISMSCWVYPTNAAPGFPDFDGFAGFRNNTDADFYMLQLTASSLECRFRNSSGVNYDIVSNGLVLNTWQHYTMTYDGIKLRVYRNGVISDSLAASGAITNTAESFYVGDLPYQGTDFYLTGQLDEVSLWGQSLSASDVSCIYLNGIDSSNNNLELLYRFNQGTAGGTNTGIASLLDSKSNINGTIANMALTGTTSNFVIGIDNSFTRAGVVCSGHAYNFYGQNLTAAGTYTGYAPVSGACDSTIILTLTTIDTSVVLVGGALHSNQSGGVTYQWINCATGAVGGATSQNFTPTANGNYQCVISSPNGCFASSGCHHFGAAGIYENALDNLISVYPNPTNALFTINTDKIKIKEIRVVNILGKEILEQKDDSKKMNYSIDISNQPMGIYFVTILTESGQVNKKIIKQ